MMVVDIRIAVAEMKQHWLHRNQSHLSGLHRRSQVQCTHFSGVELIIGFRHPYVALLDNPSVLIGRRHNLSSPGFC